MVEKGLDLLDEAGGEHLVHPARDPLVEGRPVDVDADLHGQRVDVLQAREPGAVGAVPVSAITSRARTVRRPLSGSICAAAAGSTPGSRSWSARSADPLELGLELAAQRLVGAGELEAVDDRAGVERRAADQHRRRVVTTDVGDRRARPALEVGDGRRLGDVEHVEQVVRDSTPLVDRQLRRADVHAAVDLHRVGVDHLSPEALGEVEAQPGLARCGRADEGDDGTGAWAHCPCMATLGRAGVLTRGGGAAFLEEDP